MAVNFFVKHIHLGMQFIYEEVQKVWQHPLQTFSSAFHERSATC
jgi:hypothetical protein